MKRLLLLAAILALAPSNPGPAEAATTPWRGHTTVERQYCAEQAVPQSDAPLQKRRPRPLFRLWQGATRATCKQANATWGDGTIDPQMIVSCDHNLNRPLLREFLSLENH